MIAVSSLARFLKHSSEERKSSRFLTKTYRNSKERWSWNWKKMNLNHDQLLNLSFFKPWLKYFFVVSHAHTLLVYTWLIQTCNQEIKRNNRLTGPKIIQRAIDSTLVTSMTAWKPLSQQNDKHLLYYDWLADGCTMSHITNMCDAFTTFQPLNQPVKGVRNGNAHTQAEGQGTACIESEIDGQTHSITLKDALYVLWSKVASVDGSNNLYIFQ